MTHLVMTIYNREAIPYCNLGGKSWSHRQIAEKEHLVTMDRFTWHGGTQKRDIMTKVTKKNTNTVSVIAIPLSGGEESRSMTLVISKIWFVCCLCRSLATVKDM